jgi:hypothetical protein
VLGPVPEPAGDAVEELEGPRVLGAQDQRLLDVLVSELAFLGLVALLGGLLEALGFLLIAELGQLRLRLEGLGDALGVAQGPREGMEALDHPHVLGREAEGFLEESLGALVLV